MKDLLTLDDFKHTKVNPSWNPFDMLAEVAYVARQKLETEQEGKKQAVLTESERGDFSKVRKINDGLKRKKEPRIEVEEEEDDDDDDEWEGDKMIFSNRSMKKQKVVSTNILPAVPVLDMDKKIKQYIEQTMGGSGLDLVIQKQIFPSDVKCQASRFTIPVSQVQTHDFLTETEANLLGEGRQTLKACLLEPCMKKTAITLTKWSYSGKCSSYILRGTWNSVVKRNQFKVGDLVQLWSFRVESELYFALVKVPKELVSCRTAKHCRRLTKYG